MALQEDDIDGVSWEEWENCVDELKEEDSEAQNSNNDNNSGRMDGCPDRAHIDCLQKYFGHSSFRPIQWEIIRSILKERRDNCVVMATGYGKSLTYQFPAVFSEGLSVVVSPLISLMQDQVLSLKMANIPASFLGSAQSQRDQVLNDVFEGKTRVLYVTPEFLMANENGLRIVQELSKKVKLTLVAIDEAHCVSQWGHDFRADYRKLGVLRKALPDVPFLAVTATATPTIRKDICDSLHLKNANIVCSSFDRPNLYFSVSSKSNDIYSDLRKFMVKTESGRNFKFDGPTIIYCQTRKSTEEIHHVLKTHGLVSDFYHAQRKISERAHVHELFVRDQISVIVATVAFGMGIDKPDVRNVIHWGAPKDIESYYQEVGRAGRDGLPAKCHVFYSPRDFAVTRSFLSSLSGKFLEHRQEMCKVMERYLDSTACRRKSLLMHFEGKNFAESSAELKDDCCDNCSFTLKRGTNKGSSDELDSHSMYDFTNDTHLLLRTVEAMNCSVGISRVVLCLRGSKTSHIHDAAKDAELHGKGKHESEEWWKSLNRLLLREGYLESKCQQFKTGFKGFPLPVLSLSKRGTKLLHDLQLKKDDTKLILPPGAELLKLINAKIRRKGPQKDDSKELILPSDISMSSSQNTSNKNSLYNYLLRVRKDRAEEMNCAPFHLASNQAALDMSMYRPSSIESLKNAQVDGFTDLKIQRDGPFWIRHIKDFCEENNLQMDVPHSSSCLADIEKLTPSARQTYNRFQRQNMSIEEIVTETNLARSTIVGHLCNALKVGLPLDLPRAGVHDVTHEVIIKAIRSPPVNSNIARLKPIKENCPDNISYDQIHFVVASLTGQIQKNNLSISTLNLLDKPTKADSGSRDMIPSSGFKTCSQEMQSQKTINGMWGNSKPSTSKSTDYKCKIEYESSEDDVDSLQSGDACRSVQKNTYQEKPSKAEPGAGEAEQDELLFASEINWDDEVFAAGHLDSIPEENVVIKDEPEAMKKSPSTLKPLTLKAMDSTVKRSVSGLEPVAEPQHTTHNSILKRSISLDQGTSISNSSSNSQGTDKSMPKRKMPEWLTKPNAQTEVRKKLKNNSLFKI